MKIEVQNVKTKVALVVFVSHSLCHVLSRHIVYTNAKLFVENEITPTITDIAVFIIMSFFVQSGSLIDN